MDIPKRSDFPPGDEGLREYKRAYDKAYKRDRSDHHARHKDKYLATKKKHYEANRASIINKVAIRKRNIKNFATLNLPEIKKQIAALYAEARRMTEVTGVQYTVDHIWPLKGKNSCGLHVPWNMQIITKAANDAKGNKEPEL